MCTILVCRVLCFFKKRKSSIFLSLPFFCFCFFFCLILIIVTLNSKGNLPHSNKPLKRFSSFLKHQLNKEVYYHQT